MLMVFMPWLYLSSSTAGPKVTGKGGNSGNSAIPVEQWDSQFRFL
jgi:hypothetical protein